MGENADYYIIRRRAVPDVLLRVVEANRLLACGKARTVNEAAQMTGISRSSYYKFKDDIEEFHDSRSGTTLTLSAEVDDEMGLLARFLSIISSAGANILTIHQSIPTGGVAMLSISLQIKEETHSLGDMIRRLEDLPGVRRVRVTGRETL